MLFFSNIPAFYGGCFEGQVISLNFASQEPTPGLGIPPEHFHNQWGIEVLLMADFRFQIDVSGKL